MTSKKQLLLAVHLFDDCDRPLVPRWRQWLDLSIAATCCSLFSAAWRSRGGLRGRTMKHEEHVRNVERLQGAWPIILSIGAEQSGAEHRWQTRCWRLERSIDCSAVERQTCWRCHDPRWRDVRCGSCRECCCLPTSVSVCVSVCVHLAVGRLFRPIDIPGKVTTAIMTCIPFFFLFVRSQSCRKHSREHASRDDAVIVPITTITRDDVMPMIIERIILSSPVQSERHRRKYSRKRTVQPRSSSTTTTTETLHLRQQCIKMHVPLA